MKNKTLFLCLPAILNVPFGGSSVFGANPEKVNKENSPKRPNVLVLLTDDQTFSTIHARGNNEIQTPNMDRLCQSGYVIHPNSRNGRAQWRHLAAQSCDAPYRARSDGCTPQRTNHPQE